MLTEYDYCFPPTENYEGFAQYDSCLDECAKYEAEEPYDSTNFVAWYCSALGDPTYECTSHTCEVPMGGNEPPPPTPQNPICERSGGCAKACEAWDAANDLYPTSGYYPNECEDACEAWEAGVDYASNAFQPCWCEEGFSPNSYSGWAC